MLFLFIIPVYRTGCLFLLTIWILTMTPAVFIVMANLVYLFNLSIVDVGKQFVTAESVSLCLASSLLRVPVASLLWNIYLM
jgi:hypothetical protein